MFVSLGSSLNRSRFVSSDAPFVNGSVGSVTSSFYGGIFNSAPSH